MVHCPNKNLQEWKDLVASEGEAMAYYLWNKKYGESDIKNITQIKEGVLELFKSNSELANAVYEALGFTGTKSVSKLDVLKKYLKEEDYRLKTPAPSWITDPTTTVGKMLEQIDTPIIKDTIAFLRQQNKKIQELKTNANLITNELYKQAGIDPVKLLEDESTQIENIQRVQKGEKRLLTLELDKLNDLKTSNRDLYEQIEDLGDKQAKLIRESSNVFEKEVKKFFNSLIEYDQKEIGTTITPQQKQQAQQIYSQYLDTIFPDSKVKDIIYRGDKSKTHNGVEEFIGGERKKMLFFTNNINVAKNRLYYSDFSEFIYKKDEFGNLNMTTESEPNEQKNLVRGNKNFASAIVNIISPLKVNASKTSYRDYTINGKIEHEIINDAYAKEYDSLIVEDVLEGDVGRLLSTNIAIKSPKQMYILGSKQDIEGFKQFVSKSSVLQKTSTTESPIQELENILGKFLGKLGVSVETIGEGDFVAKAKLVQKIIQVVQGKADVSTLPEEASHFFVELLDKNSTLYKQMFDTIEQYEIYGDTYEEYKTLYLLEDGSVDINKIKREAIAKLISQHVVNLFKEGKNVQPSDNWFKRAWNVIIATINKGLKSIGLDGFTQLINKAEGKDSFVQSAEKILKGDITDLAYSNLIDKQENYEMLQKVNTTQQQLVDAYTKSQHKIEVFNRKEGIETVHGYGITLDNKSKEILITATTVASTDARKKNKGRVYKENPQWTKQMEEGTMTHAWVQDFINNKFKDTPVAKTTLYNSLSPFHKGLYDDINADIDTLIESLKKEFPDSKFMTEVKLYDPEYIYIDENGKKHKGLAGSIDLLILHPDGTASIYDWKTRNNKEEFTIYKFAQYGMQVALYKQMLMRGNVEMGIPRVKGIKRSRLVPLDIKRDIKGNIIKIKYAGETPVAAEYGENEKMNSRIEAMYARFYKLIKAKSPKDPAAKKIYFDKLNDLKKMLITLQLKQSYNDILEQAEDDLHSVLGTIQKDDVTSDELQVALEVVSLYVDILDYADKSAMTPAITSQFNEIANMASEYNGIIVKKQTAIQQSNANKYGIEDLFKKQRGIGWVGKTFNSISEINHPMIAYLHEMIKDSLAKTEQESNEFRIKVKEETAKLAKWASDNGMSLQEAYNKIINKEKGRLLNKYSPEYWAAKEAKEEDWLKENMELDKDMADAEMAKFIEDTNKTPFRKNPIKNKQVQNEKIEEFRKAVYSLNSSFFARLKKDKEAKWYSVEYSNLLKPANKPLLDYYNFYTESTANFAHKLPSFGYRGNFIPNVNKTIVESIFKSGAEEGSNLISSIKRLINVDNVAKQDLGMIDVNTGTQGGQVPMYFVNSVDPSTKSFDLGRVLQMFGEMVYNYENMSEIETNSLQTLSLLKAQQAFDISSVTGKKMHITGTANFKMSEEANKNWVEMYETFLEYYIYGVKTIGANKFTELLDQLNSFTATTMLGLSIFPAIAATTANISNTAIQAARNDFFSSAQWGKSIWMLSGGSATNSDTRHIMYGFLELFQPHIDNRQFAKDRNLSSSIAVKSLSSDHLFVGLRAPDMFNQAAVFGAMIQNYTFNKEGKIVKIKDLYPKPKGYYDLPVNGAERKKIDADIEEKIKGTKSLLELGKIVDGKFTIEGHEDLTKLSDRGVMNFRQLVRQVNKNIIGNVDTDDIAGYRVIAYFRSLMLFRNWMPRAISERYGKLKYNRELQQHTWGRYNTFYNHLSIQNFWANVLKKNGEQVNEIRWGLLIGVEKAAKIAWIKAQKEDDDLLEDMTEEQFIELYKSNIKASYRGVMLTFAVMMMMWGGGKYFDDDDKLTQGEKFWKKALKRTYSELAMFANPLEALIILKSPSAALSPLATAANVIKHGLGQSAGFITDDEEKMKKYTPGKYVFQLVPVLSGATKTVTAFSETIDETINK